MPNTLDLSRPHDVTEPTYVQAFERYLGPLNDADPRLVRELFFLAVLADHAPDSPTRFLKAALAKTRELGQLDFPDTTLRALHRLGNDLAPIFDATPRPDVHPATFVLTWNPARCGRIPSSPHRLPDFYATVAGANPDLADRPWTWAVGRRDPGIQSSDRVVLLRQGDFSGVVAVGYATSSSYACQLAATNTSVSPVHAVDVRFESVAAPSRVLPIRELLGHVPEVRWRGIRMGTRVPDEASQRVDDVWATAGGLAPWGPHRYRQVLRYSQTQLTDMLAEHDHYSGAIATDAMPHEQLASLVATFEWIDEANQHRRLR